MKRQGAGERRNRKYFSTRSDLQGSEVFLYTGKWTYDYRFNEHPVKLTW
jgi:hypothetical protein